jgi:S-methylmethionine-dependent homocysteine/selenocysteine methylase
MSYAQLKRRLDRDEVIILDGATGTELQRRGAKMDDSSWSAPAALTDFDLLTQIHADYIRAGSDVVTANTFSASRLLLEPAGYGDRVAEVIRRSVEAAQRARVIAAGGRPVAVAGSISHMLPVLPGQNHTDPARLPSKAAIADAFNEQAEALKAAGADLIILEMMFTPYLVKLALDAALGSGLPVWFGMSVRRAKDGHLIAFEESEEQPHAPVVAMLPTSGIDVAGCMHTNAEIMLDALATLRPRFKGPLMAYPESGYFEMPDWRFVDVITPERLKQFYLSWLAQGVRLIGGCCGLSAEHIKAAADAREAFKRKPAAE